MNSEERTTLNTLMQSNMTLLRSIKTDEMTWLYHYTVLMGAVITYMSVTKEHTSAIRVLIIATIGLTLFLQYTMLKQRRSYYNVLRTILRIQNALGLFKNNAGESFFDEGYINKGFPKGYGPDPKKNGTDPGSSFLWRLILICFIQSLTLNVYMKFSLFPDRCFHLWFVLDALFIISLFVLDHIGQQNDTKRLKGLIGTEKSWIPDKPEKEKPEE